MSILAFDPPKHGKSFSAYNCDAVEFAHELPEQSIDLSVYSPPFSSLYIYSESERDMGNVANHDEFRAAYEPLVAALFRATKEGRVSFVHCSDIPTTQSKDGVIGLYDFPALVREVHEKCGWVYHSRVTIWKDPVVEMQRTKAHGLLYKTFRTDASRCRHGMPDYCLVFRKPVDAATSKTPEPVNHNEHAYPITSWQELASPVWMTINQTNTLNVKMARDQADERHLCPLQLDVIERAIKLYSNEGDSVYSPFMGVGSEGYVALRHRRRFIGTELKESYYRQAVKYLDEAERLGPVSDLFAYVAPVSSSQKPRSESQRHAARAIKYDDDRSNRVLEYLGEIDAISRRHKLSLSHEDTEGGFQVIEINEKAIDKVNSACDYTEEQAAS